MSTHRKLITLSCIVILICLSMAATVNATTISFWHCLGGIHKEILDEMIDTWNKEHPEIQVDATYVSAAGRGGLVLQEKLLTAIAGGTPPDVAYFNRHSTAAWVVRDAFIPLTAFAEKAGVTADKYIEFAWREANWKGELYGLPFDTDGRGLYWNKDLFAEVGLDPESPPRNITELDTYAEKLTKFDDRGRLIRMGFIPWLNQGLFYTWVLSFGGQIYDEVKQECTATDPKIIDMLNWVVSYAKKYDINRIDTFSSAFGAQEQNPFYIGQVAMVIDGSWAIKNIEAYAPHLNFGVGSIPYPPNGANTFYAGGWSVVIPRGAKHPKEAFEFMKWFAGEEGQFKYCSEVYNIPTHLQALKQLKQIADKKMRHFLDLLPFAHGRPITPEIDLLKQEGAIAYDLVRHFKKTPEQAMRDLEVKVNKAMKRWK